MEKLKIDLIFCFFSFITLRHEQSDLWKKSLLEIDSHSSKKYRIRRLFFFSYFFLSVFPWNWWEMIEIDLLPQKVVTIKYGEINREAKNWPVSFALSLSVMKNLFYERITLDWLLFEQKIPNTLPFLFLSFCFSLKLMRKGQNWSVATRDGYAQI